MRWSVIVIARNEAERLPGCLARLAQALAGEQAAITVLLNDCHDGSRQAVERFAATSPVPVRGFAIGFGDKSNAWNQYVHGAAAERAELHVFVDGYAHVAPGALPALAEALAADPRAHAATGVPSEGHSAPAQREAFLRWGGLHGSLHALRGGFVEQLRACGLRLPVGLYRGDGLIGSFAMYDLDPRAQEWDRTRVAVVTDATWSQPPYRLSDLPRHWNRRVNQARGRLESAAIRRIVEAEGFEALPRYADRMLRDYLAAVPAALPGPIDLFGQLAVRRLAHPREPGKAALAALPLAGKPAYV